MADDYVSQIDLSKLETQLRLAIEEDEKYQRENAAKFRAIEQSKTYEEFRNIVKASHLKPLDKQETLCTKDMRPPNWNRCNFKNLRTPGSEQVTSAIKCASDRRPKLDEKMESELGYHNFQQFWLLLSEDLEGRLKLLERAFITEEIFKSHEISVDLIVGIMETLNNSLGQDIKIADETNDFVINIMKSICTAPRFNLQMLFLSEKERIIINQLKEKIKIYIKDKEEQEAPRGGDNVSLTFLESF